MPIYVTDLIRRLIPLIKEGVSIKSNINSDLSTNQSSAINISTISSNMNSQINTKFNSSINQQLNSNQDSNQDSFLHITRPFRYLWYTVNSWRKKIFSRN